MRVDKIASWINNSKGAQKVLRAVSDNPALASAGVSFVVASLIRPSAQSLLPIKDEKDKAYTIASSVATGVTELAFATALFIPANKAIQNTSRKLFATAKDTIYKENPVLLRQVKSLSSRFLKLGMLPVTSWLRFAAVAPFVKLLFKGNKKVMDNSKDTKKGGKVNYEG